MHWQRRLAPVFRIRRIAIQVTYVPPFQSILMPVKAEDADCSRVAVVNRIGGKQLANIRYLQVRSPLALAGKGAHLFGLAVRFIERFAEIQPPACAG